MDDKNSKNQMDLFTFLEDGNPEESSNQTEKIQDEEQDALDFNTGDDSSETQKINEEPSSSEDAPSLILG